MRWLLLLICLGACKHGGGDDAKTSMMSVATRADSPVAMTTFDLATLDATATTFGYGRAGTCRLPRAVAAFGIVGCPVQVVRGDDRIAIDYDDQFRLVVYDKAHYDWDGNEVVGGSNLDATLTRRGERVTEIVDRLHHSYLSYDGDALVTYPEAKQRVQRLAADHDAGMLATVRSVPRSDWPCERVVTDPDGRAETTQFVYGPLAACHFPITFQTEGIIGCPIQLVTAADGSGAARMLPFDYREDRMIEGTRHVGWREDGVALDNAGDRFESTPDGVRQSPIGATIELAIADGKLQRVTSHAAGADTVVELAWAGARLDAVVVKRGSKVSRTKLAYDCKP